MAWIEDPTEEFCWSIKQEDWSFGRFLAARSSEASHL